MESRPEGRPLNDTPAPEGAAVSMEDDPACTGLPGACPGLPWERRRCGTLPRYHLRQAQGLISHSSVSADRLLAPMAIAEGTQFGPYRLLEKIGAGGMGEVYRVLDTRLEREVALKLVSDSYLVAEAGSGSPSLQQPHDTPTPT